MGLVTSDTPMMRQFNELKKGHPDCILFFRAGDFYEMFGDDAVRASEICSIALTTRNKNSENAVPMCGLPYHSYEVYLDKLTNAGMKVAIVEQMEEATKGKALVRREVVRVVTPGTSLGAKVIEGDRHHYIAAIEYRGKGKPFGLALADLTTGGFEVMELAATDTSRLFSFLLNENPREILLPDVTTGAENGEGGGSGSGPGSGDLAGGNPFLMRLNEGMKQMEGGAPVIEAVPSAWFNRSNAEKRLKKHFGVVNLSGFGVEGMDSAIRAGGALLGYLDDTQKCDLVHISTLKARELTETMWLDADTVNHLELFHNPAAGGGKHTLFATLNKTRTPMGARLLRGWLGQPLLDVESIVERQDGLSEFLDAPIPAGRLRDCFGGMGDMERIIARISLPVVGVADVVALREALQGVGKVPEWLVPWKSPILKSISEKFDPLEEVHQFLCTRLAEEPSLKLTAGGYIRDGVNPELDDLRALSSNSKKILSELEASEKKRTGISSLKIRFNKVFGYYLEISRAHSDKVPPEYIRKQTLVNAERYTTLALEELEEKILGAEERVGELEYAAFQEIRAVLGGYARRMQVTAGLVAELDALAGLAEAARENNYCKPKLITEGKCLSITGGRHPVLERIDFEEPFVPNDLALNSEQQIMLITGPNMAGKSTVMRQVALIQLMAQVGSFVPAKKAELSLVDRIFTRVGASDNLSRGQSTFMLEMNEAANILHNATEKSLVVLDEIGRGTSTYDGISIAWAMVEFLHQLGPLTLFATHYHELTQLSVELPRLRNYNFSVREEGEHLVFTRKLNKGGVDKSYGIQVARLAGLPKDVVKRAHEVMAELTAGAEEAQVVPLNQKKQPLKEVAQAREQLSFLADATPLVQDLRSLNLEKMTPMEALNFLYKIQKDLDSG